MTNTITYMNYDDYESKINDTISKLLYVIEASGINAHDAENIPTHLYNAIVNSNKAMQGKTAFTAEQGVEIWWRR